MFEMQGLQVTNIPNNNAKTFDGLWKTPINKIWKGLRNWDEFNDK
jgi:hypothetical protein